MRKMRWRRANVACVTDTDRRETPLCSAPSQTFRLPCRPTEHLLTGIHPVVSQWLLSWCFCLSCRHHVTSPVATFQISLSRATALKTRALVETGGHTGVSTACVTTLMTTRPRRQRRHECFSSAASCAWRSLHGCG